MSKGENDRFYSSPPTHLPIRAQGPTVSLAPPAALSRLAPTLCSIDVSRAPAFVPPMTATVVPHLPEGHQWLYELKLDG